MKDLRHFSHFSLAGFTYWEGALVFNKLQIGTELRLDYEPDNRYDPKAVAIYFGDHKLGYVPRSHNGPISKFLEMGHHPFACYIQQLDPAAHPEQQVGVVVFVKKAQQNSL